MSLATEANGEAGDQYIGLDRFGRIKEQRWLKTSTSSFTDQFKYHYDQDSNVLARENALNSIFSELYHSDGPAAGYDQLGQMTAFRRGTLSDVNSDGVPDTVATASRSQSWAFDGLGNFTSQTSDGTAQTRSHNAQNQITSINGGTTLVYDNNGNLTTDEQGRTLKYNAWNRLVEVKNGASTLTRYSYDALGRRVTENPGTQRALYYSAQWQVIEERESGIAVVQAVFSPVYVDALILRERDTDGNGTLDERLWVQQDANWNITALLDNGGAVVERFAYDPYGAVSVLTPTWAARTASLYAWRYLHQGGRLDPATGMYHFRHREYSPSLGRWVQVDPLGFGAGDVNFYRALGNGLAGRLDPSGLSWLESLNETMNQLADDYVWGGIASVIGPDNIDPPQKANKLDDTQAILDTTDWVPVIGDTADVINGGIYLWHGEWFEGGTSMVAAVPVFGTPISKGLEKAKKAADAADTATDVAKGFNKADNACDAAKAGRSRDPQTGRYAKEPKPSGVIGRFSRENQYPKDYRTDVREDVIRKHTNSKGQVIDPETGKVIPPDQVTIEHKLSVVEHWNTKGRFQTRQQRIDWYNDKSNLTAYFPRMEGSDFARPRLPRLPCYPRNASELAL